MLTFRSYGAYAFFVPFKLLTFRSYGAIAHLIETSTKTIDGSVAAVPLMLALDLGTSGTRAAVYDEGARELPDTAAAKSRIFTSTLAGGSELDPERFCVDAEEVIDRVLANAGDLRIDAVALTGFWHGLLGIDGNGQAVTPIYGWADTRAWREAAALREQMDERAVHGRTGCRLHAGYWPAKLAWLRANHADQFSGVAKWISPGDYLLERWCGEIKTSVSMASATGLFDQHACDWDSELCAMIGLEPSLLPELADDEESFSLKPESCGQWPALAGSMIYPAIGDGAANNVGVGCVTQDKAALMIGTSGAMRVLWPGPLPAELPPGLWQYRLDRERVVLGGALSDGGGLFRWMRESLAIEAEGVTLEAALGELEPDGHGLTVLPFWFGERSTGWNSKARGGVFGVTAKTPPQQILRAAMEAVAYRFAAIAGQLKTVLPFETIYAAGGALRESRLWAHILADVLGRRILLTDVAEASSRGAALYALERSGIDVTMRSDTPEVVATIIPNMKHRDVYRRARERQQTLRDLLYGEES